MSKSILEVLDELESVSGRLAKESILRREKDNDLLKKVFYTAQNPYLVYFVNKFKRPKPLDEERTPEHVNSNMVGFIQLLYSLSRRELTGNSAREAVERFLAEVSPREQKWMERIILKNLRVGVQDGTLNKIWPGLVPSFSVQLAHVLDVDTRGGKISKIATPLSYPVVVEPKLDGFRLVAMKESGKVSLWTRNGNKLENFPELQKLLEEAEYDNHVLDGEIFGQDWSVSASVVLSEKNLKDESLLTYHAFDLVPVSEWRAQICDIPFEKRRQMLSEVVTQRIKHQRVRLVMGREAESEEEIVAAYLEHLEEGYEGAMIKDMAGTYDFKRSNAVLKMKPISTHEGVIVGWYEGKSNTKREGLFGGFEIMLPNGVVTRCGTGFNDSLMATFYNEGPSTYKGRVIELEGQLLTDDGKIRFPRFKRFRDVRDVAPEVAALAEKVK